MITNNTTEKTASKARTLSGFCGFSTISPSAIESSVYSNHYHWVLETPESNLVRGIQWFQNTYTRRFNQRHRLWGHVFGSRYKTVVESDRAAARDYLGAPGLRASQEAPDAKKWLNLRYALNGSQVFPFRKTPLRRDFGGAAETGPSDLSTIPVENE